MINIHDVLNWKLNRVHLTNILSNFYKEPDLCKSSHIHILNKGKFQVRDNFSAISLSLVTENAGVNDKRNSSI